MPIAMSADYNLIQYDATLCRIKKSNLSPFSLSGQIVDDSEADVIAKLSSTGKLVIITVYIQ